MKKKLKIGIIGLGCRGNELLKGAILPMDNIEIKAVCDQYKDRVEQVLHRIEEKKAYKAIGTCNYKDIIEDKEIDAVLITTAWDHHIYMAIEAMKAGKYVGIEVGGAYSIKECWDLVKAYEETKVPCMMLENCCYGREELMVLNMVKQGVFGEIVHCQGGYRHDLRKEISFGRENRHYRLDNYRNRNCENYLTHELGPIAKVLDINHGNRMLSLVSIASKAAGLHQYLKTEKKEDYDMAQEHFMQGDVVSTMIRCAHGETITLTLDTTLPRAYSREFHVQGTKGMYMEDNRSIFIDGVHNSYEFRWKEQWNNIEEYREKYEHPIWKEFLEKGVIGGHDGMDTLVLQAFFDCVREKSDVPIDVYDAAAWMAITPLSEQSIAMGGMPVCIPDFTNGAWIHKKIESRGKWFL